MLEGLTYAQVAEWSALNTKRPQLLGTRRHTGYISRRAAAISEDRGEEIEGGTAVTLRVFVYLRVCVFMYLCICVFVCHLGSWRRRNRGWVCPIETRLLPLLLFDLLEKYNRESLKDWLVPIENRLALVKWDFSGRQGGKDI